MKDTPQEYLFGDAQPSKSCKDSPIIFTSQCRHCPEYQECKHAWRVYEQLEDF